MRNESMNLSKNEMMMVMHDQEQEIEKLKSQVAELQAKLDGYEIKVILPRLPRRSAAFLKRRSARSIHILKT